MSRPKKEPRLIVYCLPESNDPKEILKKLYTSRSVAKIHGDLWGVFKELLEHNEKREEPLRRKSAKRYQNLYEWLNDLYVAGYLITQQEKKIS